MPSTKFLHLASDSGAAAIIEESLRRLERNETVFGMRDGLQAGPLHDVDSGAASRVEWWGRLGMPLDEIEARNLDDADLWAEVRAADADIMLWHGHDPGERIFVFRACWHLQDRPDRVHEVALPARVSGRRPALYSAVGVDGPNETTKAWDRRAKVADVAARAERWEELRSHPGDGIRSLDADQLVQRPVTAYDPELLEATGAGGDWTPSMRVAGLVIGSNPTSLALIVWRIRELLRGGTLEGRGDENDIGLPDELRVVRGS